MSSIESGASSNQQIFKFSVLNWKFKRNQRFHLNKLFNISDSGKTVIVIVGFNGLWTIAVKTPLLTSVQKVDVESHYLLPGEEIKTILRSSTRTFALSSQGIVYDFLSAKKFEEIDFLLNVRFISSSDKRILVLRTTGFDIVIEIYPENFSDEDDLLKKFELNGSRDVITKEASMAEEKFYMKLEKVTEFNKQFLQNYLINELTQFPEVLLLSIDSKLIWVREKEQEMIANFLSAILEFHIFHIATNSFLLVLEENFTLTLIQSRHSSNTVVSTKIYLADEVVCYEFVKSKNCFVYTTSQEIIQIAFRYDGTTEKIEFDTHYKKFPGIALITQIQTSDRILAITENQLFYEISLNPKPEKSNSSSQNVDEFFEMKDKTIKSLDQITDLIFEEQNRGLVVQENISRSLKFYQNFKKNDNLLRNCNFVCKYFEPADKFQQLLNQNFVVIELHLNEKNLENIQHTFEDFRVFIEKYNPSTGLFMKKVQKLESSVDPSLITRDFKEMMTDINIKIIFNLNSRCIKTVEVLNING